MRHALLLFTILCTGCPSPVGYRPNAQLLARYSRPEACARLERIIARAEAPSIEALMVRPDRIRLSWAGRDLVVRFADVERVEIYENNKVFALDKDGRELIWLQLPRRLDCTRFADYLRSLRKY